MYDVSIGNGVISAIHYIKAHCEVFFDIELNSHWANRLSHHVWGVEDARSSRVCETNKEYND